MSKQKARIKQFLDTFFGILVSLSLLVGLVWGAVWVIGTVWQGDPEREQAAQEFANLTPAERDALCFHWYRTGEEPFLYGAWCD